MNKIIGNTTVTPVMPADWNQTDEKKVDYIKNKPGVKNGDGEQSLLQKTVEGVPINKATGTGAVALGDANRVNGDYAMAVNHNNKAHAPHSFVANSGNVTEEAAEGAFVAGHGNTAVGKFQTVVGAYAEVSADDIFVVGSGNSTNKRTSIRVDRNSGEVTIPYLSANKVSSESAHINRLYLDYAQTDKVLVENEAEIASAVFTKPEGSFNPNEVTADGSMSFGGSNEVHGRNSVALLTSNIVPKGCESVFVVGHKNTANMSHQYIFGTYSDPNADGKDLFIIGNGEKRDGVENKRNAFVVRRDGKVIIKGGSITIGSTEITEGQLKKILALIGDS